MSLLEAEVRRQVEALSLPEAWEASVDLRPGPSGVVVQVMVTGHGALGTRYAVCRFGGGVATSEAIAHELQKVVERLRQDLNPDMTKPLRRFRIGQAFCVYSMRLASDCPHCAELAAQGDSGARVTVTKIDRQAGTITLSEAPR